MGKSIRSKREKRLRTLRRKIAEPHYAAKDQQKLAILEEIVRAPSQYTLHWASKEAKPAPAHGAPSAPADASRIPSGGTSDEAEGRDSTAMDLMDAAPEGKQPAVGRRRGGVVARKGGIKKKVKLSRKVQKKIKKKQDFPV